MGYGEGRRGSAFVKRMIFFLFGLEIVILLVSVFFVFRYLFLLLGMFYSAPYVPLRKEMVERVIALADIKPGEKLTDLGSGDGRVLIASAKRGAIATGYEIDPFLIWWSRFKIKRSGFKNRARVIRKNLWKADLSDVNILTLYLFPKAMQLLEEKCHKELPSGARIISTSFPFPKWKPEIVAPDKVYLYRK